MARFLLIHGASHGAWCWRDVVPLLERRGHEALALDLPAHGADRTPPGEVRVETYVGAILAAISEPVILVGHSMGGMWITAAAEAAPEALSRLVYLAAWAPKDGQSARDMRQEGASELLVSATRPGGESFTYADEALGELFYNDCPPGTLERVRPLLCPEPTLPAQTRLSLGPRHASVPRSYIRCTGDRAILPAAQARMSAGWDDIHELASGHSPFLAMPDRLADKLIRIAEEQ